MPRIKKLREYIATTNSAMSGIKKRFGEFISAVKSEREETKDAFDLLLKASRGQLKDELGQKRQLSEKEIETIRQQSIDVLKMIGITSLSILPGGTIVFILLKLFKLNDHILPSSFKNRNGN